MISKCVTCGEQCESPRKLKYCSKECKAIWVKENPRLAKHCLQCGKDFKTNEQSQIYCSYECRGLSVRRTGTFTCKNCAKEYIPKMIDRDTFCSRGCNFEYMHKNKKPVEEKELKVYKLICTECGKEFKATRKKKYCSNECMRQRYKKPKEEHIRVCGQCGNSFATTNMKNNYCSEICKRKHNNRKDYVRRDKRLKRNGRVDHSITLERLYLRDKGICFICGQKIDVISDSNSDWYGSIDHVQPISKGGTHSWDNIRLAHRLCNNVKRDNPYYTIPSGQFAMSI